MLTVMFNIFLGVQNMLNTFLMVVICLCTDVFVSVALVNETAEDDIMTRLPRKKDERLVDFKLLATAYFGSGSIMYLGATVNFFWYMSDQGLPFWAVFWAWNWTDGWYGFSADQLQEFINVGQCVFFVSLVIMQAGNCLAVRTRRVSMFRHNPLWGPHKNLALPVGVLCAFLTAVIITEGPFFQVTFLTRAVPIKFALVACCWAVAIVLLDEGRKYIVRNYPKSLVARVAW